MKNKLQVPLMVLLGSAVICLSFNTAYAAPFMHLRAPLTPNQYQFLSGQTNFHLDNQTSGAIQIVSNETGQNVTQYLKYNPDRASVTVGNSTMTADFSLQIPYPKDPNTVEINRINLPLMDTTFITRHNATDTHIADTLYSTSYRIPSITLGNATYNHIDFFVSIPQDQVNYMPLMNMWLFNY